MASHAPQMCPVILLSRNRVPRATEVRKTPSGQIVPIIGNSLIQTVANSSTIWRGAVVGTFPVSNMKTPSHPGAVSEVRHLASQKDGRVFEVRPGLKFYKPSPGPTLSRRRV